MSDQDPELHGGRPRAVFRRYQDSGGGDSNFEVIGEATKRLGLEITGKHPELPWRQMAGFRDILIHAYDRVDVEEVWNVVEKEVPELAKKIRVIRDELAGPNRIPPPTA